MAINRYTTPAQASFVNTYVPIPFDEMAKIGEATQGLIEKNDAMSDQALSTLNAIKVAPADEQSYLATVDRYRNELNAINNNAAPGSYEAKRKIMDVYNRMSSDTSLRMMSQNYSRYTTAKSEYDKAAALDPTGISTYELGKQLSEFNKGEGNLKGTEYLRSRDGVGLFEAAGIAKPAEIAPTLDKYLEPVKADAVGTQGLDASGKFIVGSSSSQISAEKLGSVLGINFVRTIENGKTKIAVDYDNVNPPADLRSTEGGRYLWLQAKQMADNSDGSMTAEEAYKALYADAAVRSINSHVSSSSEYAIDANPYALENYKEDLKNKVVDYSSPISIATDASKLTTRTAINDAIAGAGVSITTATKELETLKQTEGATQNEQGLWINRSGKDITPIVREKQLEIDEFTSQKASLESYMEGIKRDARVPTTYEGPSPALQAQAEEAREKAEQAYIRRSQMMSTEGASFDTTTQVRADARKAGQEAYEKAIITSDPYYKAINQRIKESSADLSFVATVTRFGDARENTAAEEYFTSGITNLAAYDTAGNEISERDKARLAKLSFVTAENGQGDNVFFKGAVWNKEKHMYQYAYTVNDSSVGTDAKGKKPSVSKTILIEAPAQAVDILISKGLTNQAQQVIQQQASMMNTNANREAKIYFGDPNKDQNSGTMRQVRESEKPNYKAGTQYLLEVPIKGEDGVIRQTLLPFSNITEAGIWYEQYRRAAETEAAK